MKRAWIDLETGGLDPKRNPILQLAVLMEDEEGKIADTFFSYIRPDGRLKIEADALEVNGITLQQLRDEPPEYMVMEHLIKFLKSHKVGTKQFEFCGYNSRFDMDFFVAMFKRSKYQYWHYFNYYDVDVFALVKILGITGKRYDEQKDTWVDCKKLSCICEMFDIDIENAHDAIDDIKATRKLFKKLKKKYLK